MKWLLSLLLTLSLFGADGPQIFYSRQHQGGTPAYVQVVVHRDGNAAYRESVDDPDEVPIQFRLRPNEVDEIFELAGKLEYFRRPLESNLKVANMGAKTFRYIDGDVTGEQTFNFSQDADARVLADWFAKITESEMNLVNLDRTVRFDKLGVNKVLLQLQASMERNRLAAPDQFLPLLDKIVANVSFLNMARSRAAGLAEYIRGSGGN